MTGITAYSYEKILEAAKSDNLTLFKSLVNLEHGKDNHRSIFSIHFDLLNNACSNNNIKVFKYIYDYHQSVFNNDKAYGFDEACDNQNMNILHFLIFEQNIERDRYVEDAIKLYRSEEAEKMFETRELHKQLKGELKSNQVLSKKDKL